MVAAMELFGDIEGELREVEAEMVSLAQPFGLLGQIACDHLASGGKRLRARLALAAMRAQGGEASRAGAWAAACELLHNATLIHDDVQDRDRLRRGKPTVWAKHGVAQAVNAGDLLLMLAGVAAGEAPVELGLPALLARRGAEVMAAQARDLAYRPDEPLSRADYRDVVLGKTSALFALPVEGALRLSGQSAAAAARVGNAVGSLGVVFQLQDDLLDLVGDNGHGEPAGDFLRGRMTALATEHCQSNPDDRQWLLDVVSGSETPAGIAARLRESGAVARVVAWLVEESDALSADDTLVAAPPLRELICALSTSFVERVQGEFGQD